MSTLPHQFALTLDSPTVADFISLRTQVGWESPAENNVKLSLQNSLFHVAIYDNEKLIAMGRVIGDGAMYFYIQDVVVAPDYQGLGLGATLMDKIEHYLSITAKQGATVGLFAAKGKEAFYARYAYLERPNHSLGNGMCKFL